MFNKLSRSTLYAAGRIAWTFCPRILTDKQLNNRFTAVLYTEQKDDTYIIQKKVFCRFTVWSCSLLNTASSKCLSCCLPYDFILSQSTLSCDDIRDFFSVASMAQGKFNPDWFKKKSQLKGSKIQQVVCQLLYRPFFIYSSLQGKKIILGL